MWLFGSSRGQATESSTSSAQSAEKVPTSSVPSTSSRWKSITEALAEAEARLLSNVKAKIATENVEVSHLNNSQIGRIHSITVKASDNPSDKISVVFLHGFASGLALWTNNIDCAAQTRTVYALDLLGFGRSSRPNFHQDPLICESEMCDAIEDWRRAMNIEKMILVGHSFGGFIACAYALKFPDKLRHLVLLDPWGFCAKPSEEPSRFFGLGEKTLAWIKSFAAAVGAANPLAFVRYAGPYGVEILRKLYPNLGAKLSKTNPDVFYQYLYHCNIQNPTGETAYATMSYSFGWAKHPMLERIFKLPFELPITFFYGSKSCIDSGAGLEVQMRRSKGYVDVQIIRGAGHYLHIDASETFNTAFAMLLKAIDADEDVVQCDTG